MARPTTILKTILGRRAATIFPGAANGLFPKAGHLKTDAIVADG